MDLGKQLENSDVDWGGSRWYSVAEFYEHGNEPSGYLKAGNSVTSWRKSLIHFLDI
jgi:hypothetical protein